MQAFASTCLRHHAELDAFAGLLFSDHFRNLRRLEATTLTSSKKLIKSSQTQSCWQQRPVMNPGNFWQHVPICFPFSLMSQVDIPTGRFGHRIKQPTPSQSQERHRWKSGTRIAEGDWSFGEGVRWVGKFLYATYSFQSAAVFIYNRYV